MRTSNDPYASTPAGSIITLESDQELEDYAVILHKLPKGLFDLAVTAHTGAFLRGVAKQFDIPVEQTPTIAFAVLQIMLGERRLAELATLLSAELRLANDKAQAIAKEIERELFAPVMLELNQVLETRNSKLETRKATQEPKAAGARNVIDLRSRNSSKQLPNFTNLNKQNPKPPQTPPNLNKPLPSKPPQPPRIPPPTPTFE